MREIQQKLPFDLDDSDIFFSKGIDELFATVKDYAASDKFRELLRFTAHFKLYAPYNAMLIYIQKPGARFVLPARSWRNYNRTVINDRRPLIILWPFAPVYYVYDVTDTMVLPNHEDGFREELAKPFEGDPTRPVDGETFRRLVNNLKYWGVVYGEMKTGENYGGKLEIGRINDPSLIFSPADKCPRRWSCAYSIRVSSEVGLTTKFAVILHELGHLFCNHLPDCYGPGASEKDMRRISHAAMEFEAETVSWLVCQRLGVDNPSYKYLAHYFHENQAVPEEISVDAIMKAAHLAERVLSETQLKKCYLYMKSAEFRKAVDQYRAALKEGKNPDWP